MFLLYAAVLIVVLIVLDAMLFRFKQKRHARVLLPVSAARNALHKAGNWFGSVRSRRPKPQPEPAKAKTGASATEPSSSARAQGVIMQQESVPREPPGQQKTARVLIALAPLVALNQFFQNLRERPAAPNEKKSRGLQGQLLIAAVIVYALIISIGIDSYPIYFFTDEAIHMNLASDFIRDGFRNYDGEFLPTFFTLEGWVNGVSVYVQLLPYLIFGKSVIVTRLVSAFISLLGALCAGLLLKNVFKLRYSWAVIFLLLTTPAWFLHARTAFEYVEVASFYSMFIYFYSHYRQGDLQYLYAAIVAGALAFYTHGLGQFLMAVTGLGLFIVDFRYHSHPDRRKTVLYGLLLGLILLLPFARYYLAHPGEAAAQVRRRGSYWMDDNLTSPGKIWKFLSQYACGLNPRYWYFPNTRDISRHIMNSYGNGWRLTLPLMLAGLFQAIKNIRLPSYRIVLVALLACPVPASVVAIGMPRMLWMAFPLAILSAIGLSAILQWMEYHLRLNPLWGASGLFIVLTLASAAMLRDALVNGPTWTQDYGLYGMQYGAQQVFQDTVAPALEQDPDLRMVVSPSWANGTQQFAAFFVPKELSPRLRMGQPINCIDALKTGGTKILFVATSAEYQKLLEDPKFTGIRVHKTIAYPNGEPGFYLISLKASATIDQIIAAEFEENRKPVEDILDLYGQTIRVIHSPIGSGRLEDIFDNDPSTFARVKRANPFFFDLYPPAPILTRGIVVQTGSMPDFTLTVSLYAPGATEPVVYTKTFKGLPADPKVTMSFANGPEESAQITIEIKDNLSGDSSQIHVRTIKFE